MMPTLSSRLQSAVVGVLPSGLQARLRLARLRRSVAAVLSWFPEATYDLSIALPNGEAAFVPFHPDSELLRQRFDLVAIPREPAGQATAAEGPGLSC